MKITRKMLDAAVEELDGNEDLTSDLDPSQVSGMLWQTLKSMQDPGMKPEDYQVILRVEGLLSGLVDGEGESDPDDYRVTVTSKIDEVFSIMNPRITKMEIS